VVPGILRMYTITHQPKDLPGVEYAVREFLVAAGGPHLGTVVGTADTLEDAREKVPAQADCRLPRHPDDDPVIVETWA
jgi:hypothetical protein